MHGHIRPMNPANFGWVREVGRGKTSRPNPLRDASPGGESQALGNDSETAQSSANMASGCHCLPLSYWIFPRTEAQLIRVTSSHQQEMHSLESGLPNSPASSKMNLHPRPLPSGSVLSHGRNRLEVNYQDARPSQALHLTLASVRTSGTARLTCPPSQVNTAWYVGLQQSSF